MTAMGKQKIAVQGAFGRVGSAIVAALAPFYEVHSADALVNPAGMWWSYPIPASEHFAIINAAPYHTSGGVAAAALEAGAHYLDLTEDVQVARTLAAMADGAKTMVVPQCGLAPGLVSILAGSMVKKYDKLHSLKLRVGGLPRFPTNMLGYALTWNVEGLINQYSTPANAIRHGELVKVNALDDVEELQYEGGVYEAFNTSVGVGTLCESFHAHDIDYKTIRYPGHAKLMKFLMRDLAIARGPLQDILEKAIPQTDQDVVLVSVTSTGFNGPRLSQATYSKQFFGVPGKSALRMTTAASVCAVLDMMADGTLKREGFVKQEEIPLEAFVKNRFGRVFV